MSYRELLSDARWLAKRARILERDGMRCRYCGDEAGVLEVHHFHYAPSGKPWEVPDTSLITLCPTCHETVMKGWFRTPQSGQREIDRIERRAALAREFAQPEYEGLTAETLYHYHRMVSSRMAQEKALRRVPPCSCAQCQAPAGPGSIKTKVAAEASSPQETLPEAGKLTEPVRVREPGTEA